MDKGVVGIISDTHGLLRPGALDLLAGCDRIIHAGDIGSPEVIDGLARIAPVTAVRGNVDRESWADRFPATEAVAHAGAFFYVLHNLDELDLDPAAAGFDVVVYGHSHRPAIERRAGVLYVNPGSAGPRRFSLPIALALLSVAPAGIAAEIREISV